MKSLINGVSFFGTKFEVRQDKDQFLPQLQSHRGFRNTDSPIRENTLQSIQKAYEFNYKMVEFDVRLTLDQQVVLFHDDNLKGKLISHLNLSELRTQIQVDLLSEVFDWYVSHQIRNFKFNIEIKSKSIHGHLEKKVFLLVKKFNLQNQILISSFNPISLMYIRLLDESIFRSLLLTFKSESGNNFVIKKMLMNFLARPNALHLNEDNWNQKIFSKLLSQKIPIVLWTCNDINKVNRYFEEGITGVISDNITPEHLKNN